MTAAILADFKTDPYLHQLKEFEASADVPGRALLWQMRTGKTKVTIDTACHLAHYKKIEAVVVIAPNGVHENWLRRELPIHHWNTVDRETLSWRTDTAGTATRGLSKAAVGRWRHEHDAWWTKAKGMLTSKDLTWFAFNSESMTRPDVRKIIARIVRRRRTMVVFDESQDFRTPGSKRTHMARALAKRCPFRRILTGTVVTNSPLHAFSQYELLEPEALGFRKYSDFKDQYAEYEKQTNRRGQTYPVLKCYKNLDELQASMAPWSSVVLRGDCNDLPDLIRRTRTILLSEEQKRLYKELHKQFILDVGGKRVSIGENTSRLTKLQQIVSGFLIDEWGDVHDIPGVNPRLEALSDEVFLSPGKIIVWCRFQEDMDRAVARLIGDGHEVVQYHGRVSDDEKARVRELFAPGAENNVKALVGYPTVGLDLSAATQIVWYSHAFDAIMREQADERATAMGGENVPIIDIVAPGVDEYVLENVFNKVSIAEALAGVGMQEVLRRLKQ